MAWIDFLDKTTANFPEKIAIVEQQTGRRLSYSQLSREVNRWANFLASQNVQKGERVALLKTNSLEHMTIFFACAKLGALFVPLNFRLSTDELREIIHRIEVKVLIGEENCVLKNDFPFIDVNKVQLPATESFSTVVSTENDPLLMLFTSGSTGLPKGVMLHGKMLMSNQIATCEQWGLRSDDICLVETPFFHTGGYNVLSLPLLYLGGTCVLASKFDVENVYRSFATEKISVYFAVPTMFQMLAEHKNFKDGDFSHLRFLISGGAHCSEEIIKMYQEKNLMFKQGFGLTEVGPNCFLLKEADAVRKIGSIGQPMPHSRVMLVNDEGQEVGAGEVGELLISGDHVCAGYFRDSAKFEESLLNGFFKTGDLAKKDDEGFYFIVGRKKDMYISGGENVYPAEVERKLLTHHDVLDAIIVPVPDERWGEVGYAFIRASRSLELPEVKSFLDPILSRYKQPHYLKHLNEFPLLASGKINKQKLKELAQQSIKNG